MRMCDVRRYERTVRSALGDDGVVHLFTNETRDGGVRITFSYPEHADRATVWARLHAALKGDTGVRYNIRYVADDSLIASGHTGVQVVIFQVQAPAFEPPRHTQAPAKTQVRTQVTTQVTNQVQAPQQSSWHVFVILSPVLLLCVALAFSPEILAAAEIIVPEIIDTLLG